MLRSLMTFAIAFDNLSAEESESEPTTETSGGVIMFMMASVMALLMIFALEGMTDGSCWAWSNDMSIHNTAKDGKSQKNKM